jgi:GH15 family glucan-1,4-alpha-glucosidase
MAALAVLIRMVYVIGRWHVDPERGGSFTIRPQISEVQNKQIYAAESNVLITRFLSVGATTEVIDFMPLTASTQKRELIRIVRVIHGRIPFRLTCQPAFDYARSAHEIDEGKRPANNQCCAMLLRPRCRCILGQVV